MLRNYLKTALRSLGRNKFFSAINILGLGLGIACSLLIFLWVEHEWSYDAFHAAGPNLYRVMLTQRYDNGQVSTSPATPALLTEALKKEFPGVKHAVVMTGEEKLLFEVAGNSYRENGAFAGPDFFAMFSFPLLQGNPKTVLSSPYTAVISRKLAQKYFGNQNVTGKSIRVDNREEYQISGVFEDVPANSSLQFDFLLSFKTLGNRADNQDWNAIGPGTFVHFGEGAPVEKVEALLKNYLKPKQTEYNSTLSLQPYEDMHLYGNFKNGVPDGGRIAYVRLFSAAALFILLIACINFINLITARAARRSKEVGIRKVVGASRSMVAGQFLAEALLTVLLSLGLALLLSELTLPLFNAVTGYPISIQYRGGFLLVLLVIFVFTGLVSGLYPAFFLSSFRPAQVLKGTPAFGPAAAWLRQGLVVFQFSVSCILIIGTLVVYLQTQYISRKNLGFTRENVVYARMDGDLLKNLEAFKNELSQSPHIQSVTAAGDSPLHVNGTVTSVEWPGKGPNQKISFLWWGVNYDFVKTLNLRLVKGRDFSRAFANDTVNVLINEEAAKMMGRADPVGQPITVERDITAKGKIIGVIKNFHLASLHTPIQPLIMFLDPQPGWGYAIIRTTPGHTREALQSIEEAHKKFNPHFPFEYEFADQDYDRLYRSEMVAGRLAGYFAVLAIFISCLGLFGLAAFTAGQRTKEIGVRKVLGASVGSIVSLLSRDFLRLVLLAVFIASPVAWYAMNSWLQDFAYKTAIHWWVFAVAGLLAAGIALLTVSYQTIKAAIANPVKSLRSE